MPEGRLARTRQVYELESVQRYKGPLRFHPDAFSLVWPSICVCEGFESGALPIPLGTIQRCDVHPTKTFYRGPSGDC